MKDIEYHYNDKGEIGVLVSRGYGAGWSTWNHYGVKLAVDKRIIDKILEHIGDEKWFKAINSFSDNDTKIEFQDYLSSLGYEDVCTLGLSDCEIEYVPFGSVIRINEYDGFESLEIGYTDYTVLD